MNWTASSNRSWLNFSPASGSAGQAIAISVNASGMNAGSDTGTIAISSSDAANSPQSITVYLNVLNWWNETAPFGGLGTPINNSNVSSSIPVTGWVLDDVGVESVSIFNGNTFIGNAIFVDGARPDVESAYPNYPNSYKAGWGYMMLTNFLPNGGNGTFQIIAKATDTSGNVTTLGSAFINVDNANAVKPFGAIDTPTQGGTASGSSFVNWGWVLTPLPNSIKTDGSTIKVWVNGKSLGNPVYNNYRSDIASLFPGYANSNGAVGYFYLNTTAYDNGVHTIQWTATDSGGNTDGIGSRYFTIQNSGGDALNRQARNAKTIANNVRKIYLEKDLTNLKTDRAMPALFKKGFGNSERVQVKPDEKGTVTVTVNELDRLEVKLFYGNLFTGYVANISPLPIGSTLDEETGTFYWQLGAGFVGDYTFRFADASNGTLRTLKVVVKPKE
jgi:hypothetical protein